MATWGHSVVRRLVVSDGDGTGGRLLPEQDAAYEYLCRLEEAKKWLESVLSCELPVATELEDALQNGVLLCRLGIKLLPDDPMWKKVYDIDQTKFKTKGLDYRYTDNINFWLASLQKLGLPKVFYPVMTDIFHKKNMPKLMYCLHALSHLLQKKGMLSKAVEDLYGLVNFPSDALVQTSQTLKTRGRTMPAFGVVENLVEEELQYQAMGLCDSYEEDVPPSPDDVVLTLTEKRDSLFDDPKYMSSTQAKQNITVQQSSENGSDEDSPFAIVPCVSSDIKASLYIRHSVKKKSPDDQRPLEKSLLALSATLDKDDSQETLKALQSPAANLPFVYRDKEAYKYHEALLKEKREGLPQILLPVYSGVDREKCEQVLEKLSPGAYIVRHSQTVEGAYVFSFKNQTGIKHWKLSMKGGKFYWGSSSLHSTLESFVENFVQALSEVTKLYIYCGMTSVLQPVFQSTESEGMINSLREADDTLSYGQVCHVIKEVNTTIRRGRKSVTEPGRASNSIEMWNESMIVKLNRPESEALLKTKGKPGSFLMRTSDKGDYALTFCTIKDIRHWKIVRKGGKYYVNPRPNPYHSLMEIIQHFREAVSQETGLNMVPYLTSPRPQERSLTLTPNGTSDCLQKPPSPQRRPLSDSLSKLNPANITSWSVDDVCQWLTQEGLGRFIDIFRDNAVDGDCLLTLDNMLLKDDLGVTALGHRSRIMKRVLALKEQVHPQLS